MWPEKQIISIKNENYSSVLMILFGDLNVLITLQSVSSWCIYSTTIIGIIILKLREPKLHRPYQVWMSTAALMSCISIFLLIMPFFKETLTSAMAVLFVLSGLPVYWVFIGMQHRHPSWFKSFIDSFSVVVKRELNLAKLE